MYSSSKEALKRSLNGLAADIQANDADDIELDNIVSRVSKGRQGGETMGQWLEGGKGGSRCEMKSCGRRWCASLGFD
jgi:hypothetical protein